MTARYPDVAFPKAARAALSDSQLRANLRRATSTIRTRRRKVIADLDDFEALRRAGAYRRDRSLANLASLIEQFAERAAAAGARVHAAGNAEVACRTVYQILAAAGFREVLKVKSMTTMEIGLNDYLEQRGIKVKETDLAELIVQMAGDLPTHIVVPAIHKNRSQIRKLFLDEMGSRGVPPQLSDDPADLARAARQHLREQFLRAKVAVCGANFAIAETGSVVLVESEGNGRMCTTLASHLIVVVGIEKITQHFSDLQVYLQLLARSATGERLSPYTTVFTGTYQGDGPKELDIVLVDNARSGILEDPIGREALRCIRCAACLNVCPVYERTGGAAYGSVYPGPIGAVLAPQLTGLVSEKVATSLPFASSLCGACFEVCPVRIDIPKLLVHLRAKAAAKASPGERLAMGALAHLFADERALGLAERTAGRLAGAIPRRLLELLPAVAAWSRGREVPLFSREPFRMRPLAHHVQPRPPRTHPASPESSPRDARPSWWPRTPRAYFRKINLSRPGRPPSSTTELAELTSRVRRALSSAPYPPTEEPGGWHRPGELHWPDAPDRFARALEELGAKVIRATEESLPQELAQRIHTSSARSVAIPRGLPPDWLGALGPDIEILVDDPPLGPDALDLVDWVITGAELAVAESGTIVLAGGANQGRRALSLIPDRHLVVLAASQVKPRLPDALGSLDPTAPLVLVTGPSATSDIEMSRVVGVHGPRHLEVILVEEGPNVVATSA